MADPKPAPKVRDFTVYEKFHEGNPRCLACGRSAQAAHLLRGKHREDVLAGLVPLCAQHHAALDSGGTHYFPEGGAATPRESKAAVAAFLRSDEGAAQAGYLIGKLGAFAAEDFVQRLEGRLRPV